MPQDNARSAVLSPAPTNEFVHRTLANGIELAVDHAPERNSVAVCLRMLTGVADDPPELTGIGAIVERTLSKGTQNFDGRGLADAFDAKGIQWSSNAGRVSMLVRFVCLPEFVFDAVDLVAEMLCRPIFPADAVEVAVKLAAEDLRQMEDDPQELLRIASQRLTLGPIIGRYPAGDPDAIPRITREAVVERWRNYYAAGRLQITAAGPVNADALAARLAASFGGFGSPEPHGRIAIDTEFQPGVAHRQKELKQEYIAITMPGLPKGHAEFAREQVLLGVLSGGMSGRLFTEVREKQGLVYWVAAWHEQLRGRGAIYLGASTTPERCEKTYRTLLREIERISEDLTIEEVMRARNSLIAHAETEDDLTMSRAVGLSDDLFHFGRPVGLAAKLASVRAVTLADVEDYARGVPRDRLCVATIGPHALTL